MERTSTGFDLPLLCLMARFGNDMAQIVDCRQLPAHVIPHYQACKNLFNSVFGLLEYAMADPGLQPTMRAEAVYELSRHHQIKVQIMGDSVFNLSRFSQDSLMADEDRFANEMKRAIYYAGLLRNLPKPARLGVTEWKEVLPTLQAIMLRGQCYSRYPKRRPNQQHVELILRELSSPQTLAKRESTQLHYSIMQGDCQRARRLVEESRGRLSKAPDGALPGYLSPIFTINSRRLGGDVTDQEHKHAVEIIRSDHRIILLCGHHLIGGDSIGAERV